MAFNRNAVVSASMLSALEPFAHSIALFDVCGDAEAYVFDFDALTDTQRADLVDTHLRAFADNLARQRRQPSTRIASTPARLEP